MNFQPSDFTSFHVRGNFHKRANLEATIVSFSLLTPVLGPAIQTIVRQIGSVKAPGSDL
jgi:hypothetical protein